MRRLSVLLAFAFSAAPPVASADDIYHGLHGADGALCCGHEDCIPTTYREQGGDFEFLTREGDWVRIPSGRISFRFVPGDPPNDDSHHAHLCYRPSTEADRGSSYAPDHLFGPIWLRCAFIPPGGV